ncbi:acetylserotonin O-methyltransferase isoform X6 [Bubalus kerabau]|uniref:acetylserotonin O-methyltransferase isoform X6 n=1 Tax=Bubalus carabanensis TaxID=3119969 RepID=UPI00244EBFBA|nr:acetylserotonin O-methyltransferase isoform X6 [Bubalus carabanensis]
MPLLCRIKNSVYANTELASTYVVRGSPRSQRDMLLYAGRTAYVCWRYLAEAVREGRNQYPKAFGIPSEELFSAIYRSEDERLQFMQGLQDVWRLEGATVLAAFDLSPFPLICDLGGGSGALAKACVSLYPGCRVIVYDIPGVVQMAKRHFSALEDERISFHEGDFFKDALPEADLYILARVLHDWTDAKCSHLLQRVYQACRTADACLAPGSSVHLASSRVHLPPSRETFLQFARWMLFADALEQRPVRTGMTWHWADRSIAFPGFTGNTQPQVVPGMEATLPQARVIIFKRALSSYRFLD